ncbi:MAG: hypothetical protein LH615_09860 [Ferruginibacter sp.]|nr:hypothetical protein [Ferruginibacter sp.]
MKKIIFTSLIAVISLTTFAQGNSQKNKNNTQSSVSKKEKDPDANDRYDDRYDNRSNKDRKVIKVGNDNRNDNNNKYSKNTPSKVRAAFNRDFPNANNVTWTKNTGTWTANFGGGGILGNTNSVTYKANGQRVSTNRILGRRIN